MIKALKKLLILCGVLAAFTPAQARTPEELGVLIVPRLSQPDCRKISYNPTSVYESPSGVKVGELVLDNPDLAVKDLDSCVNRPRLKFVPTGFSTGVDIKKIPLSNGHFVIPFYDKVQVNGASWYQIKNERAYFRYWVAGEPGVYGKTYAEDLVQGLEALSEICEDVDKPCIPVSFNVTQMSLKASSQRKNCQKTAYDIVKIIKFNHRIFYLAKLAPELEVAWDKLPKSVIVPAYNAQNQWTGVYYHEGCAPSEE